MQLAVYCDNGLNRAWQSILYASEEPSSDLTSALIIAYENVSQFNNIGRKAKTVSKPDKILVYSRGDAGVVSKCPAQPIFIYRMERVVEVKTVNLLDERVS